MATVDAVRSRDAGDATGETDGAGGAGRPLRAARRARSAGRARRLRGRLSAARLRAPVARGDAGLACVRTARRFLTGRAPRRALRRRADGGLQRSGRQPERRGPGLYARVAAGRQADGRSGSRRGRLRAVLGRAVLSGDADPAGRALPGGCASSDGAGAAHPAARARRRHRLALSQPCRRAALDPDGRPPRRQGCAERDRVLRGRPARARSADVHAHDRRQARGEPARHLRHADAGCDSPPRREPGEPARRTCATGSPSRGRATTASSRSRRRSRCTCSTSRASSASTRRAPAFARSRCRCARPTSPGADATSARRHLDRDLEAAGVVAVPAGLALVEEAVREAEEQPRRPRRRAVASALPVTDEERLAQLGARAVRSAPCR